MVLLSRTHLGPVGSGAFIGWGPSQAASQAISYSDAGAYFGWLGQFFSMDNPTSGTLTRELLGWRPVHPALIPDLEEGLYFNHY